jgi:PAS domain S-box-containing protein
MGIGIPDRFGSFLEANDEMLRITGYSREDLEAGLVRWDTMTPKEYAELDQAHIEEAAQRGSCTPYEKEYIRKDGTRVPIFCGYALLEGSRDQYIGFVRDMSAEKRAEAALREREQRYRILAESLPQFVWERDAEGKYIYCNQRLLDYVGRSIDWLSGEVYELVHPDDQKRTRERWNHSTATGEIYLNEYRLRRHDGTYRYFLTRASPIRDKEGQIERWLGCTIDIHDQKIAEEGVRRSEKLAAMGRLAATMAHEINNPLTAVTNSIYLALQDPALSDETRHFLNVADQELARAVQVATRTLRFHRQSSAPARVNITDIMDSVFALYGPRFRSASIVLEREYLDRGELYCFSDELRQVFANVISNSVDAMARGGRLRVRVRNGKSWNGAEAAGVTVVVVDTGDGIPQHLQHTIFEPFVTTKESTGTGLGLWVSEGIVKKHNGRIAMRSSVDPVRHGTAVSMFFPFDGLQQ